VWGGLWVGFFFLVSCVGFLGEGGGLLGFWGLFWGGGWCWGGGVWGGVCGGVWGGRVVFLVLFFVGCGLFFWLGRVGVLWGG